MQAYLDNAATTRCTTRVAEAMVQAMCENFGNPSSMHLMGVKAEQVLRDAKTFFAKNLKVKEKEIYFTSGGTESNNLAILGTAMANQRAGKHLITTVIEHPSVSHPMKALEKQGFRVTYLPVDKDGIVSLEALQEALCEETILVSVMYVNNEIGAVQPIEQIAKLIKEKSKKAYFHVDAIQAYGKYQIYPGKEGIDLLSISGHKLHAPKGVGLLYINEKVKIHPLLHGGGQQKDIRSGTENIPGIIGITEAARACEQHLEEHREQLYHIKQRFVDGVQKLERATVNGRTGKDSAPHIVSVSFEGVRSEVLLHALEEQGVYVSAGSACASNKPSISPTLQGIGLAKELLSSTLRFSFIFDTTEEEIDYCLQELAKLLPVLRRYVRR